MKRPTDLSGLPARNLADRLRWLCQQRGISAGLYHADEIVRLSGNLLARLDLLDGSLSRLIDLYESEDAPTPEHAAAWEEARQIMGRT